MKEVSKKTGVFIWSIFSIIFAVIYTLICDKIGVYNNNLYFERITVVFAIAEFFGLNIIIGFKNLWDFIIEKRYIIALICLVTFTLFEFSGSSMGAVTSWILEPEKNNTVLGNFRPIRSDEYAVDTFFSVSQIKNNFNQFSYLLGNKNMFVNIYVPIKIILSIFRIYNIAYIILPNFSMAYSFVGNFKLIASILITYEFLLILTNNKRYLSVIGTMLIIGSSFINWWFREAIDIIAFGELSIILLDSFMQSAGIRKKLLISTFLAYSITAYIFILYPAWQISFGYLFFVLAIWVFLKNRKEYKFKKIDLICFILTAAFISIFLVFFYNNSYDAILKILKTSYPGARNENGGKGLIYLFGYLYGPFLPFEGIVDSMAFASFLSFFPIPIIMALVYIYKKEKHIEFLLPMLVVLVLETIWCISGFPQIISKITLLNMVPVERCAVAVGLGSIYLYIYMIANVDEKFIKQINSAYIVLAILILIFLIPKPSKFNTISYLNKFAIIATAGGFLLLNFSDKRYRNVFLFFAVIITLISGLTVNPIVKGIKPITKTDFAQFVQNEVSKKSDAIWITENMDMVVSNYLVAQGAKTLNATQTYPNEKFWKRILENKTDENKDTWNRYAHIRVLFTSEDSSVFLGAEDKVVLNLNKEKLKELNVHYIVSYKDNLEQELNLKKIYSKKANEKTIIEGQAVEGIYIYEFVN